MLKQFAPKASTPPSPKISACSSSATDTDRQAAYGPSSAAISVPPTACPVVPPGIGMLNIMLMKENAAPTPISAIFSFGSSVFTFRIQTPQTGIMAAAITPQVCGLR